MINPSNQFDPQESFRNNAAPDRPAEMAPMKSPSPQQLGREFQLDYEVKTIFPAVRVIWGEVLFWVLTVITGGLWALFFRWNFRIFKSLRFSEVPIQQATHLIMLDEGDEEVTVELKRIKGKNNEDLISAEYRHTQYIFNQDAKNLVNPQKQGAFIMVRNLLDQTNNQVRLSKDGLKTEDIEPLRRLYGPNSTKITLTPLWLIFIDEALTSFNLYQIFAAIIWWFREYFAYAVFILIMAFISLVVTVIVFRFEQNRINKMA